MHPLIWTPAFPFQCPAPAASGLVGLLSPLRHGCLELTAFLMLVTNMSQVCRDEVEMRVQEINFNDTLRPATLYSARELLRQVEVSTRSFKLSASFSFSITQRFIWHSQFYSVPTKDVFSAWGIRIQERLTVS